MQSERFIHLLDLIIDQVQAETLVAVTNAVLPGTPATSDPGVYNQVRTRFNDAIFAAQARFHQLNTQSATNEVLNSMGISEIFDSQNISQMIYAIQSTNTASEMHKAYSHFSSIVRFNSALKSLIKLRDSLRKFVSTPRLGDQSEGNSVVRFEVLDLKQDGFGFGRLEAIIPSLHSLFAELCRVFDADEATIRIAYMDSGSGLTIGIKGDLKVIDSVKRLFIAIWDKIRFREKEDFKKSLEVLDSSLDVLVRIKEKQDAGVIDAGEAARLKHVILNGAVELLQAGTNLQELQSADVVDNEALLIQLVTPKYLTENKSLVPAEQQS